MHLCLICNEYPPLPHGGIGSFSKDLAEGLGASGHQVTVLGISPVINGFRHSDEKSGNVRVVKLSTPKNSKPVRFYEWWKRRKLRHWLKKLHKETPFDLIECPDYSGWLPFGGIPGKPTVVRMNGSSFFFDHELDRTGNKLEHFYERQTLRRAHYFISVSMYVGQQTFNLAGIGTPVCPVIYNGVDAGYFARDGAISEEEGLIVYVNSLNPKKGVEQLIKAANEILPMRPLTKLVIIGGTPLRGLAGYEQTLKDAVAPEVRERVIFTGRLPRDQVLGWLQRSSICCYPSLMEAFAIAPLEAMSVGKPVIYSLKGPGPEAIEDGVSGLLCDPHDPASIRSCIERLLDSASLREELGNNARRRVMALFDKRNWIDRNVAFYAECITKGTEGG